MCRSWRTSLEERWTSSPRKRRRSLRRHRSGHAGWSKEGWRGGRVRGMISFLYQFALNRSWLCLDPRFGDSGARSRGAEE
jgi:hypothetical protein